MPDPTPRALLLDGTVGAGKSTVAAAIGGLLRDRGVPHGCLDLDDVRRVWPPPPDDRFGFRLTVETLTSLAASFVRAGADRLVVSGVVETRTELRQVATAVGMPLVTCRLVVDADVVRTRLVARHADDEAERRWHLARAPHLAGVLDAAALEDHTVDTSATTAPDAAREVLRRIGW